MAGFYISQHNERTWDVNIVFLVFQFFAVITYPAMLAAGLMYQKYLTSTDAPQIIPPQVQEPARTIPNMGELNQYAQTVKQVTARKDVQFYKTLLAMKALDETKTDLREDRWKSHFGSRENYIQVRSRLEQARAIARKDARLNSPFVVINWRVIQLLAQGQEIKQ